MPQPLRTDRQPEDGAIKTDAPKDLAEVYVINALIRSGDFTPERYGLTLDDVEVWKDAWRYCQDYQRTQHHAPSMAELQDHFVGFRETGNIGLDYAVKEMHEASYQRKLRLALQEATTLLTAGEAAAVPTLFEKIAKPKSMRRGALDGFDHSNIESELELDTRRLPVPHESLGRVTGGIAPGDLWYYAARPSHGKTYTACTYVAEAVARGYSVRYVSCEMPAHRINHRIARVLTRGDRDLLARLASNDRGDRKYVLDALREQVSGSWSTVDPSHGRIDNAFVREQMEEQPDLLVVDHMGLMRTNKGHRAIDDWRAMAEISNQIREDNLATMSKVLGLVQISRAGESASSRAPRGSTLSQSDALLQDCDVLITMKRLSKSVMVYSPEKIREDSGRPWYSNYDPAGINFKEITADQARDKVAADEAFLDD